MTTTVKRLRIAARHDESQGSMMNEAANLIEQQQQRIAELEVVLQKLGYCTECMRTPDHSVTEPTSSCRCSTGEDYATRPLQKLQLLEKQ